MIEQRLPISNIAHPLVDADLTPHGQVVAVTGQRERYQLCQLGTYYDLPRVGKRLLIRSLGDQGSLVIADQPYGKEENAFVYNTAGEIVKRFYAGFVIMEVVPFSDIIAIGYGDVVYGGRGNSLFGLVLLDLDGNILFHDNEMVHCYGACARSDYHLLYLSYPRFMLIQVDVRTLEVEEWPIPEKLHGASAVTSFKDKIFLHSPYHDKKGLYCWQPDRNSFERIGEYPRPLRGLRNGRFLAMLETDCIELSMID